METARAFCILGVHCFFSGQWYFHQGEVSLGLSVGQLGLGDLDKLTSLCD